jgi:FkbM family methyltransferase
MILRSYPFLSGQFRILNSRLVLALEPPAKPREVVETTIKGTGIKILAAMDDFLDGRGLYYLGNTTPKVSWLCRRFLRSGDVFMDVGANHGLLTLIAAKEVGPGGQVHAFEPQPGLVEMIRESCALNNFSNVVVHPVALSDHDARMTLHISEHHSGSGSLTRDLDAEGAGIEIEVDVRAGATYLEQHGVPAPRMIKIDVEGHEAAVLLGLAPLFDRQPPVAVIFESNDRFTPDQNGDSTGATPFCDLPTIQFLRGRGYEFFSPLPSLLRLKMIRVDPDARVHPDVWDILAVRTEQVKEFADILPEAR